MDLDRQVRDETDDDGLCTRFVSALDDLPVRAVGDEVQKKLEEKGHIYAQESLSGPLLRLTRDKHVLRRLKDKKGWVYVS
jgi:hypothetical protein